MQLLEFFLAYKQSVPLEPNVVLQSLVVNPLQTKKMRSKGEFSPTAAALRELTAKTLQRAKE